MTTAQKEAPAKRRVYLDSNASTPIAPEVFEAMEPFLKNNFGNPSSGHYFGRAVKAALEIAREEVADLVGADPSEIIFCSGGTESDNMAIKGSAWNRPADGSWQVVTSAVEHPAVLNTVKYLGKNGYQATIIGVDETGTVDVDTLVNALDDKTAIVSLMHANNEVGTIQPVAEVGAKVRSKGILMHTDAVQSLGKIPVNVNDLNVDLLSLSGHKLQAPKGVGALYVRKGTKLSPLLTGGHHERGRRAGTENVPGIVGLGRAARLAKEHLVANAAHAKALRDELDRRLSAEVPYVRFNGHRENRLPTTLNVSIECVEGETLLIQCDMNGIAISTGSACSSGSLDPSHVLTAMGIPQETIHGSLRFSFGPWNNMADVDYVMSRLPKIIEVARAISPLWDGEKPIPVDQL